MIVGAFQKTGLKTQLQKNTSADLIVLDGPGVFVSSAVTKSGGNSDHCEVRLILDGVNVVAINYIAGKSLGLDHPNNSGVVIVHGTANTMTIQFSEPILFKTSLIIQVFASSEEGITQVFARAILAAGCSYPA